MVVLPDKAYAIPCSAFQCCNWEQVFNMQDCTKIFDSAFDVELKAIAKLGAQRRH